MFKTIDCLFWVFAAASICCFNPSVAQCQPLAGDYVISHSGGDFSSLSEAVGRLNTDGISGDVRFLIQPEDYIEGPVRIIHFPGSDSGTVRFVPIDTSLVTFTLSPDAVDRAGLILDDAASCIFEGIESSTDRNLIIRMDDDGSGKPQTTILIRHSVPGCHAAFRHCELLGCGSDVPQSTAVIDQASGSIIEDCLIGSAVIGIRTMSESTDIQILNNVIGSNQEITKLSKAGCWITGSGAVLLGNRIHNISVDSESNRLENQGVILEGDKRSLLQNNLIYGIVLYNEFENPKYTYCINSLDSTDLILIHNTLFLEGNKGLVHSICLSLQNASSAEVINNCIYNCRTSLWDDYAMEVTNCVDLIEHHNFIDGSDGDAVGFSPDPTSVLSGDPEFESLKDLHIQSGSACRDICLRQGGCGQDFDGVPRDEICDAGAYEYPSDIPTPTPENTGVYLEMPSHYFRENQECYLKTTLVNGETGSLEVNLFVMLDCLGVYFWWPSWRETSEGIDFQQLVIDSGVREDYPVPPFNWPEIEGSASGFIFWAAMTDPAIDHLIGTFSSWNFGYGM